VGSRGVIQTARGRAQARLGHISTRVPRQDQQVTAIARELSATGPVFCRLAARPAIHFGCRGLHPDYSCTPESSRSFGSETMRSRPTGSDKTRRRPTTGRAVLHPPQRASVRVGDPGAPSVRLMHGGFNGGATRRATLSRSRVFPACAAVSEANERLDLHTSMNNPGSDPAWTGLPASARLRRGLAAARLNALGAKAERPVPTWQHESIPGLGRRHERRRALRQLERKSPWVTQHQKP
jgi:hypothetical protein